MTKKELKKFLHESIREELSKLTLTESASLPTDDPMWLAVDETVGLIEKDPASKDWDIKVDNNVITIYPKGTCVLARRYNDQQLISKSLNSLRRQIQNFLMSRAAVHFSFDSEFESAQLGPEDSIDAKAFTIEIAGAR